ncbi:hypothetical protein Tco_0176370, partial [Tanacetum coccineum]
LDRYQCGHPAAPAKVVQYQQGFPQGNAPRLGHTTWRASGNDVPRTLPRQIRMPRSRFGMIPGSRSLARLRDQMRTHTVDGVFPKDEDRRICEKMKRLEATGEYTEDEINRLARGGKLRGLFPYVHLGDI